MSDIIKTVLTAMLVIFVIGLVGWVAATITDRFTYATEKIPIDDGGERTYPRMATITSHIFNYVYVVPVCFMIVALVWAFKKIIKKHLYSGQDGVDVQDEYY